MAARALDLCFGTTTLAGKFMRSIYASLAEYDRESILAKIKVGQLLAAAQGKPIGQSKGLDAENLGKGNKALDKPVHHRNRGATGSSFFSVKRYRQYIQASLSH